MLGSFFCMKLQYKPSNSLSFSCPFQNFLSSFSHLLCVIMPTPLIIPALITAETPEVFCI